MELERIKGKAEETCKRLHVDIQNIKQQKVGGSEWQGRAWNGRAGTSFFVSHLGTGLCGVVT